MLVLTAKFTYSGKTRSKCGIGLIYADAVFGKIPRSLSPAYYLDCTLEYKCFNASCSSTFRNVAEPFRAHIFDWHQP